MKKLLVLLLAFGMNVRADDAQISPEEAEKLVTSVTNALRAEVMSHSNPNVTEETHPVLYNIVKGLVEKAQVNMPRYITIHNAQQLVVGAYGRVSKDAQGNIGAWTDAWGDLYICAEVLTDLSLDEILGVLALAIAEKSTSKHEKMALAGVSTFAATAALIYYLVKRYNVNVASLFSSDPADYEKTKNLLSAALGLTVMPTIFATKMTADYMQTGIDAEAARLTSSGNVMVGLNGITKLEEKHVKAGFFDRMASALNLKVICNVLFYPVRAYTTEERIQNLQNASKA